MNKEMHHCYFYLINQIVDFNKHFREIMGLNRGERAPRIVIANGLTSTCKVSSVMNYHISDSHVTCDEVINAI